MPRLTWIAPILSLIAVDTLGADPRANPTPKVWAVVVGIDAYDDPAIPACTGAAADARATVRWLRETAGWDAAQVLLMDATSPRIHGAPQQVISALRPSRENLDWVLKEWLPYRVRPGDVVLFSFAGQALGGRDGVAASPDVLLSIDVDAKRLDSTGWVLPNALDRLASKGENPILVLLDTSLSGRGRPAANLTGRRTSASRLLGEITRWPGVAAWIAAENHPVAEPAGRGAFADAVLSAMGTARAPRNILGALFTASRDDRLVAQGFRAAGGLGPNWSLWPRMLEKAIPPPSELLLQRGHADRVMALTFSADGATMVSASMDSTIKIWRTADRVLLRTLPAHMIGVTSLALSPDATLLASGDGSGRVILWSLNDLAPHQFTGPPPHHRGVAKLDYLQDGSGFVSMDLAGDVVLWKFDGKDLKPARLADGAMAFATGRDIVAVAKSPAQDQRLIRLFDAEGRLARSIDGPGGSIAMNALGIRGDVLAAGNQDGKVGAWHIVKGDAIPLPAVAREPIQAIALTDRMLLAATGDKVWCLATSGNAAPNSVPLPGPVAQLSTSTDGLYAAACTTAGGIVAWSMPGAGGVVSIPVAMDPESPAATAVSFPSHGRTLVSGDQDGGIRSWEWPSGAFHARIAPHRGKIDGLALSRDGRFLAQIDHDRRARIWDLKEGRGLRAIPGEWDSLAYLPDGSALAMVRRDGKVVLVDAANPSDTTAGFERPVGVDGRPVEWNFGPIAVSPDGKTILSGSSQGPIACLWPVAGGAPSQTMREHDEPISAVAFADDSKHWLTASTDGSAKVWGPDGQKPRWVLEIGPGDEREPDPAVTAAKIAPGKLARVVTGHRDGRLVLWTLTGDGKATPLVIGRFDGEVHAVAFSPDGRHLMAAGADKTVRLWDLGGAMPPRPARRLTPQHTEQVNALVVFPDGRLMASAGDDTTIRFWQADAGKLVGTLATSVEDGTWVAFDPEGRFDSAPGGEVQVSFLQGDRVLSLDQFSEAGRTFGLGRSWLEGRALPPITPLDRARPSGLAIDPPSPPKEGEIELTVHLGDASAKNLRLYQNDMPVRDADDFATTADPAVRKVRVRLDTGENRFVAMASRPEQGAIHGRSNVVAVLGPKATDSPRGSIHTLAIGVSDYGPNSLKYADRDALDIAGFLHRHGANSGADSGLTLVLRNDEVSPRKVEDALIAIRDRARPEDTVVVFLAGHTDVINRDRFCLLLNGFPFAPNALKPGERGPLRPAPELKKAQETSPAVLPYSSIYRLLARMNARHRLVVIDACQAEAVFDDQGVRRIQDKVDDGSHRARTSYLLASRRGEPASEAVALEHGVLTHLLLRGMGATGLKPEPGGLLGNADADESGIVTTEELRDYVDTNLPLLASRVALSGPRANADQAVGKPPQPNDSPRSQGAIAVFPLAKIPHHK